MNKTLLIGIIVIIAIIVGGLAYYFLVLQQQGGGGGEETVEIHFYTSMPKDLATELVNRFQQKYPNIKVSLYRSGTSKVLAKLDAEIESGNIICDVIWIADPSGIIKLKQQGLLLQFTPADADKIKYKDPDGYWYAGRIIIPVIAWNTNIIKDNPPGKWTDLASSDYKASLPSPWNTASTWAAIPNPLYSGAATATVYALVQKYDWTYYQNLRNNGVEVVKSNSVVLNGIINGEYPVGVTLDYMVRQKIAAGEPVAYAFPEDGVIVIPSPIAIMKSTPHPDAAKKFVEFVLSKETQEWLVQQGFIPARTDVNPPSDVPDFSQLNVIQIDWEALASQMEDIRSQFENIMLK